MQKRFIEKLAGFVVLNLLLAYLMQGALVHGLLNVKTSARGVWNKVVKGEVNAELLVAGSSRAQVHYDPTILGKELGMVAYNIGRNGTWHDLQTIFMKTYLGTNRAPRVIIQNVDITCFKATKEIYEPSQYIPYLEHEPLYEGLVGLNPRFKRAKRIPLVGILDQRLFLDAMCGLIGVFPSEDHKLGYRAQDKKWTGEFERFASQNPNGIVTDVEQDGIRIFHDSLMLLSTTGAKVVVVYSPEFVEAQRLCRNRGEILSRIETMARGFQFAFLDYSDHPISSNKSYFYNSQHLNRPGAEAFSMALANQLREVLKLVDGGQQAMPPSLAAHR